MFELGDIVRVSGRQVLRTKPLGVVLAIAFGIASFLILGVLGQEIRNKLSSDFLLMGGVNVLRVVMEDDRYPGSPRYFFDEKTVEEIRKLDGVVYAGANITWRAKYPQAVGMRNIPLLLSGVDQYFVPIHYLEIEAGRDFSSEDIVQRARVCLLGHQAAVGLFGSPDTAIGRTISISRNDTAEVIGVINGMMLAAWTDQAFLPYTTTLDRQIANPAINRIFILSRSWEDVPRLAQALVKKVRELQEAPHVTVEYQREQVQRIDATFFWLSMLLWLAIGLSLILGAFGIWSGTFTSVRNRTHEIGLKKAMGATNGDIMSQFLMEALFKSIAGGLLGLFVGIIAVVIGIHFLGCPFPLVQLIACSVGSVLFSALLGVLGGAYPARQASRMDVVDSLRFE